MSHRFWFSKRYAQLAGLNLSYVYDTDTISTVGFKQNNRAALQTAINNATSAGNGIYISEQHGIDVTGLTIPTGAQIKFVGNGALKVIGPVSTNSYTMMQLTAASNVLIENPRLYGSKELQTLAPSGNDLGMGIGFSGACSNVVIMEPQIRDTWGDGIYVGPGNSSGIEIISPRIAGVRRNGISVVSANGLVITDCQVMHIQDAAPKSAIDFEPKSNTDVLKGIKLIGFKSIRCQEGLMFSFENLPGATAQVVDITVSEFEDYGCLDTAISMNNLSSGANTVGGAININSPKYIHSANPTGYTNWDNSIPVNISGATSIA